MSVWSGWGHKNYFFVSLEVREVNKQKYRVLAKEKTLEWNLHFFSSMFELGQDS